MTNSPSRKVQGMFTASLITFSSLGMAFPDMTRAENQKYYCGDVNGTPTTMMRTPRGDISLVQWLNRTFGSQWTPENRCNRVTSKFNAADQAGERQLTIGKGGKNDEYDIICSARVAGGKCQRQLMTIPKGTDPIAALETLKGAKKGSVGGGLLNSPSVRSDYRSYTDGWNGELRPYLDLEQLRLIYN